MGPQPPHETIASYGKMPAYRSRCSMEDWVLVYLIWAISSKRRYQITIYILILGAQYDIRSIY